MSGLEAELKETRLEQRLCFAPQQVTPGMTGHGAGLLRQGSQECRRPALPAQACPQSRKALGVLPLSLSKPSATILAISPARQNGTRAPPCAISHLQPHPLARANRDHVQNHSRWPPHSGCSAAAASTRPPGGCGATCAATLPGFVGAGLAEHVQWNPQLSQKLISKFQVAGIPEVNSEKQPAVHRSP